MKTRSCCFLLWTVALLAVVSPLQADVPQMINYQGVLTSGGNPVVNPVEVVFSIWNDETAGDSLWSEQQSVDPDDDGVFNVLLGSVAPIPDSVFAGTSAYLSVQIGLDPEIEPRTRIVSSGYAYRVGTVDGASGGVITDELIITDGGGDTTTVQSQRIVIRGSGGDVITEYSSENVIIYSAGTPAIEIGLDGILVFGESRAADTIIKIGSDGIVQVSGGVMFSDSTIQMTQAGASNGLPEPGGTMTGPIASVGNPYITMGKGNFGSGNTNAGDYSFVAGLNNAADGYASVVSGGQDNTASQTYCAVGGGVYNAAAGNRSTIGGGVMDSAFGRYSGVSAGLLNQAGNEETDTSAYVGGGTLNAALARYSSVLGGISNTANTSYSTVAGGSNNYAGGVRSSISGGSQNMAVAPGASVGGGMYNRARGSYSVVAGGGGGGLADSNVAMGDYSVVSGGRANRATSDYSTVGGGQWNTAGGIGSAIGGGSTNEALGDYNSIGGGQSNTTDASYATIAGGWGNYCNAYMGSILGGQGHVVEGTNSIVLGGAYDTVGSSGTFSMLFGTGIYINSSYRVALFNSGHAGKLGINRDDRDSLGINYPIHVGTSTSNGSGAYLTNGGVWTDGGGKESRGDVWPLDGKDVLGRIENIPIDGWACKGTDERHIGPSAEDFHAQFDVGVLNQDGTRDTEHIAALDLAGVALVGVQELYRMVREQQQMAHDLQLKNEKIEELELRLTQMESLVETILANQSGDSNSKLASNR